MKRKKKKYRVRNWGEYSKGLVNRGSLTVWFDEKSIIERAVDWEQDGRIESHQHSIKLILNNNIIKKLRFIYES